jgi:hypothetical protein
MGQRKAGAAQAGAGVIVKPARGDILRGFGRAAFVERDDLAQVFVGKRGELRQQSARFPRKERARQGRRAQSLNSQRVTELLTGGIVRR